MDNEEYARLTGTDVVKECEGLLAVLKMGDTWMSLSDLAQALGKDHFPRGQEVELAIMCWQKVIEGRGDGGEQGHYAEYRFTLNSEARLKEVFRGENLVPV